MDQPNTNPTPEAKTATATAPSPEAKPAEANPAEAPKTDAAKSAQEGLRGNYERFVERVTAELKEAGKVGKKQWEDAIKSTREFMKRAKPELKREDLEKLGDTVKKDVGHAVRTFRSRGEDWTRSESFLTARDKGAEFLLKLAVRVKDVFETLETNLESTLKYRKGEIVGGGRFICTSCSDELVAPSGPMPACSKCGKEEFKRKA